MYTGETPPSLSDLHLQSILGHCELYPDGDQCRTNRCVNGTCVDLYQSYACRCNQGYEGRYCDQRKSAAEAVAPPRVRC